MSELPTIVFVHGAWHGGWCWHDVRESLRLQGFETLAVDLPGHETAGASKRFWKTIGSYVDHVQSAVDSVPGDVIVVGHSMGGLVTQRLLERRQVAGAVLVASSPRRGVTGAVLRLFKKEPLLMLRTIGSLSLWPLVDTDAKVRQQFFAAETDYAVVASTGAKLQNESFVAFLSMIGRLPRPKKAKSPVLVVAAQADAIFTVAEQRDLAAAYGAKLELVDAGHDLMLEAQWPELAEHIASFARRVLPGE